MIAIIDYGMGNLRSVEKGFLKVGVEVMVTNRPEVIKRSDGVVLPGVGAFKGCMNELSNLNLIDTVVDTINTGKPYLGICLGLHILFTESVEFGRSRGLDIFRGRVLRFPESDLKVPHMGWNQLNIKHKQNPLLKGIPDKSFFYFVHSFYVAPEDNTIISTTSEYGIEFTSSVWKDNIFAVQFHPEKSQKAGLKILSNFGEIVKKNIATRHKVV